MKRVLFTIGLGIAIFTANAQTAAHTASPELVSTAGDSFKNTSYQLDWSIGELQTETYIGSLKILSQGFHQVSNTVTNVDKGLFEPNITVFPNPTTDHVTVNFFDIQKYGKVGYLVSDIFGKVLRNGYLTNESEQISFTNYAAGIYVIAVLQNDRLVTSFKISKY